ncbi:MAG TPA: hypothetical protein DDZ76_15265 [Xanthomonadales bacterium]|nr:hypothetical protein [Xanthomonadales bacterium]
MLVVVIGVAAASEWLVVLAAEPIGMAVLVADLVGLDPIRSHLRPGAEIDLILVETADIGGLEAAARTCPLHARAWIGVSPAHDTRLHSRGIELGAAAMLDAAASSNQMLSAVRRVLDRLRSNLASPVHPEREQRVFRAGEQVRIREGQVAVVRNGLLALEGVDAEGRQFLLGFIGPGEAVICESERSVVDAAQIGHTAGSLLVIPGHRASHHSEYQAALRARIASMERWARIRAEAFVEDRILSLLHSLAQQVGRRHPRGTLIDLRLTHAQLAAAVGATRSTVTRVLCLLRRSERIVIVRSAGGANRYCLLDREARADGRSG